MIGEISNKPVTVFTLEDVRDHEQIHGGNIWRMVAQKAAPSLAGSSPSLGHVFGYRRLGDLKAELEQFAMDARSSHIMKKARYTSRAFFELQHGHIR